ncbi:hypothetical protein [Amycolatopsis samaneae]|uniref:ABC transporter permease n=1 Tax=Amycolatopsis samaneae TaxID=664691 RepID=A0ABW5GWB8_9PSEU
MSVLRIELRRTIAPWTALVLLAIAIFYLYGLSGPIRKAPAPWGEDWVPSALWTRMLLVFLIPVVIGAGTIQGMRDKRSGTEELFGTASRPAWHRAAKLAGVFAGLSFLAYTVVFGIAAVQAIAGGEYFSLAWLPVFLVGGLSVIASACLGLGIGRALPFPVIAPVAAIASFVAVVAMYLSMMNSAFGEGFLPNRVSLLAPAFENLRSVFATTAASVDIGQTLWFLGVAVTGFLLLAVKSVRARLLAFAPIALGALIAIPLFPASPHDNLVLDRAAAELVCDGPVCVTRLHQDKLAELAVSGREALGLLAKLPDAPTRVVESSAPAGYGGVPEERAPGTVFTEFESFQAKRRSPADLTKALVAGAGVPACNEKYGDWLREEAARAVAAAWLTGDQRPDWKSYSLVSGAPTAETAWNALRARPEPEQRAWILAQRQALLTCHGDPMNGLIPDTRR